MGAIARFVSGGIALGRGAQLALGDRTLRRWVLLPFVLAVALVGVVATALILYLLRPRIDHGALGVVAALIGTAIVAYLGALFFAVAPFAGVLSERAERILSGEKPADLGFARAVKEALRGIGHTVLGLFLYAAIAIGIVVVHALVPPLAPVCWAAGVVQTALFVAYDFFDPVLSRRGKSFSAKWRYLRERPAAALGFGLTTALFLAVPLLGLFVPPVAVVAATRLAVEEDQRRVV